METSEYILIIGKRQGVKISALRSEREKRYDDTCDWRRRVYWK